MRLGEIFALDAIELGLSASDKQTAISELVTLLVRANPALDAQKVADVLRERERLGSTAIGEGVAIPHGKLPGLTCVVGAFARSVSGLDFESYDEEKTHLFFVLLAPDNSQGAADHLKVLAKISRLLRNSAFRNQLLSLQDQKEVYRCLVESDA